MSPLFLRRFSLVPLCLALGCASVPDDSTRASAEAPSAASTFESAVAVPASAPRTTEQDLARLVALSARDNRVLEHLRILSKDFSPRLTGSLAFDRAAEWVRATLANYGLRAEREKWGEFPVGFDRGVQRGRIVTPEESDLLFLSPAWTVGTNGPARGFAVLEPKNDEALEALGPAALDHAWILRTNTAIEDSKFGKKLRALYEEKGVHGIVRSAGRNGLMVMGGNQRVEIDKLGQLAQVRLYVDQFRDLRERIERGERLELEFDIENRFTPGPRDCHNVIADIVGSEFPNEYVIVQGHLDSWDGAEGAQDNGTGVATAIEAARLIRASGARPRRTIRFVLYGGEEQGLFGSDGYVKAHADELENISVVLTHDGGGSFLSGIQPTYAMWDACERATAPLAALDAGRPFRLEEVPGLRNSGDSDHAPFLAAGVPAFFWEQSGDGYTRVHHTQFDTYENVPYEDVVHSARVVALAALGFANLDAMLDRTDMKPLARRTLGANFEEDLVVASVTKGGRADMAGWQKGDRVVALDGTSILQRAEITRLLQLGGPVKTIRLARAGAGSTQEIDTSFDWSNEEAEKERTARAARREAWAAARREAWAAARR